MHGQVLFRSLRLATAFSTDPNAPLSYLGAELVATSFGGKGGFESTCMLQGSWATMKLCISDWHCFLFMNVVRDDSMLQDPILYSTVREGTVDCQWREGKLHTT